jgi:hypothetical protein
MIKTRPEVEKFDGMWACGKDMVQCSKTMYNMTINRHVRKLKYIHVLKFKLSCRHIISNTGKGVIS